MNKNRFILINSCWLNFIYAIIFLMSGLYSIMIKSGPNPVCIIDYLIIIALLLFEYFWYCSLAYKSEITSDEINTYHQSNIFIKQSIDDLISNNGSVINIGDICKIHNGFTLITFVNITGKNESINDWKEILPELP